MNNKSINVSFNKYIFLTFLLNVLFVLFVYLNGYFEIGLLSDSYEDIFNSLNHSFADYFSDLIYQGRFRPLLFILLKYMVCLNNFLGFSFDNFIMYNIINLSLYLFSGILASALIKLASNNYVRAILMNIIILIYPNNIINLCWSASFFEIVSLILILLHIKFLIKLVKTNNIMWGYYCVIVYIAGLMLKEINVTIPFLSMIFIFLINKKQSKYFWKIMGAEVIILIAYFGFRITQLTSLDYRENSLSGVLDITIKSVLSIIIPGDYVTTYIKIRSFDIIHLLYIATVIFMVIFILIKYIHRVKSLFLMFLLFFLSVSPYYYAGYIRPQLMLIPFALLMASILISRIKINVNITFTVILLILFALYTYNSANIIEGWKLSYYKSKERITSLIKFLEYNNSDIVILGNINRIGQFYMFDKINFIYNYWKNKGFQISNNINNILSISTINPVIDSVYLEYQKIEGRYLIITSSDFSFLNVSEKNEGVNNQHVYDSIGVVNIIRRNNFNKTTEIEFIPFDNAIKFLIFDGKTIRYLN